MTTLIFLIGSEKQRVALICVIKKILGAKNNIIIRIFHFNPRIWPQAGINTVKTSPKCMTRAVGITCSAVSSEWLCQVVCSVI